VSLWWNNFFMPTYSLRIESGVVSLWQRTKLLQSQALLGTDDFYAQVGVAISAILQSTKAPRAQQVQVYLGQGLVQHGVITLDTRKLNGAAVASAVQGFWADANSGTSIVNQTAWQVQSGGKSIFSSCCDALLISQIQTAVSTAGWKVSGITTHAAQIWNRHRSQMRASMQCVLILQDNVLSMGLLHKDTWCAWNSESCFDADWSALAERVTRFLRSTGLCDADTTRKSIYAPHIKRTSASEGLQNWTVISDKLSGASLVMP
jgi:hypothetical protein